MNCVSKTMNIVSKMMIFTHIRGQVMTMTEATKRFGGEAGKPYPADATGK